MYVDLISKFREKDPLQLITVNFIYRLLHACKTAKQNTFHNSTLTLCMIQTLYLAIVETYPQNLLLIYIFRYIYFI
jgi:hypothetical protein